jgi:hypothetical protein
MVQDKQSIYGDTTEEPVAGTPMVFVAILNGLFLPYLTGS